MIIGILKEIKPEENRVSMTPAGVEVMIQNGHTLLVEKDGGKGSGFEDEDYKKAGAEMVATPQEIFERAEMVMHVKEPLPAEYDLIRGSNRFHILAFGGSGRTDPCFDQKQIH